MMKHFELMMRMMSENPDMMRMLGEMSGQAMPSADGVCCLPCLAFSVFFPRGRLT